MLFGNKNLPDIDILFNSHRITKVNQTKFLGVIIQHNSKWQAHIQLIQNKISKTTGIMNKVKNTLSTLSLLHI